MFTPDLIEEVAATIAVPDLVRTHKTWGDLAEPQKESYRDAAREVARVVARHSTVTYGFRDGSANHVSGERDIGLRDAVSNARLRGSDVVVHLMTPWATHIAAEDLPEG